MPFANLMQAIIGIDALWWSFAAGAACAMPLSLARHQGGGWRKAHMLAPYVGEGAIPAEVGSLPKATVAVPGTGGS
ncbi:MAG: hypothetical protein EOP91_05150 [Lysobacteraceae bacterium]|nr:MAG: hypothetical protein EOP91_05150 [Xanthomonadaceae bacterium]